MSKGAGHEALAAAGAGREPTRFRRQRAQALLQLSVAEAAPPPRAPAVGAVELGAACASVDVVAAVSRRLPFPRS